jgi:Methyltransferase domain
MIENIRFLSGWQKYQLAFRNIEGWIHPFTAMIILYLARFQTNEHIYGNMAEIGVHHGKSFLPIYFALGANEIAIAIDVFENQHYNFDKSGRGDREKFLNNIKRYAGDCTRLRIIQKNSLEITVADFIALGGELRLVSIDGSHTEAVTYSDLMLAAGSLRTDGLIFLDDVYNELYPEVVWGLGRFLRARPGYSALAIVPGKVVLCGTEYAGLYSSYLRASFGHWVDYEKCVFGANCLGLGLAGNYLRRRVTATRAGQAVKKLLGRGPVGRQVL